MQSRALHFSFLLFLRFYLFIFRQRGREGEREGMKHQCVVALSVPPLGDLGPNPGICPHWESTSDPLVCRPALNPLSHTSQGSIFLKSLHMCIDIVNSI